MNTARILTAAAAIAAVLVAPKLGGDSAEAKTKVHKRYAGQGYAASGRSNCPLRQTVNGDIVDCNGWRLKSTGWDNTCLNLDYLPSMYACSSPSRR